MADKRILLVEDEEAAFGPLHEVLHLLTSVAQPKLHLAVGVVEEVDDSFRVVRGRLQKYGACAVSEETMVD